MHNSKSKVRTAVLYFMAMSGAVITAYVGFSAFFGEKAMAQQPDPYLSRRVDQMESRFYSIESRLNQLESITRPTLSSAPVTSRVNDQDVTYLRQQVDILRARLGEAECGLLHVDERTLTPAARAARPKSVSGSEPCRHDPATPITLSARP